MASKMYYTEQEAADLLGVSVDGLEQFVKDQRLQVFKDGDKNMYKGQEVEALAGDSGEIELTPAEDVISLSDADDLGSTDAKEDTVITAEGISIFDEEDLEIETADPMAKTQMAPSLEDQIALDGVGSGSGLLDLTQESDDTSLGAELLDHIDIDETSGAGAVSFGEPEPASMVQPVATEMVVDSADVTEIPDSMSGLFTGVLVGCAAVAMLMGGAAIAGVTGVVPEYIETLSDKLTMVIGGAVAFAIVAGGLGLVLGKATAPRRM
ncbi:MAG: helix-turn-helix domain-containing protein [bacterium]|nr:helix-turn-helix domain-containing protein [bacterium]